MTSVDARVGFAANAIWRALNPDEQKKTPPPEYAAEYRAAGQAVVRMFDEAATAAVRVGAPSAEDENHELHHQRIQELERELSAARDAAWDERVESDKASLNGGAR